MVRATTDRATADPHAKNALLIAIVDCVAVTRTRAPDRGIIPNETDEDVDDLLLALGLNQTAGEERTELITGQPQLGYVVFGWVNRTSESCGSDVMNMFGTPSASSWPC